MKITDAELAFLIEWSVTFSGTFLLFILAYFAFLFGAEGKKFANFDEWDRLYDRIFAIVGKKNIKLRKDAGLVRLGGVLNEHEERSLLMYWAACRDIRSAKLHLARIRKKALISVLGFICSLVFSLLSVYAFSLHPQLKVMGKSQQYMVSLGTQLLVLVTIFLPLLVRWHKVEDFQSRLREHESDQFENIDKIIAQSAISTTPI